MTHSPYDTPRHDPYAALRISEFRYFVTARFFMTICFQIVATVVGWQIYMITKDPLKLGLIGLTEAAPNILVSLFGGHMADLFNRKKIILYGGFAMVVCVLFLLLYTLPAGAFIHQSLGTLPVYAVIFCIGIIRGIMSPAIFAFLAQIVPRTLYPNSSAWNSNIWQVAAITGPAIGGIVYGKFGISAAYATAAVSILISLGLYVFIKSRPLPARQVKESIRISIASGLKFVFSNQMILGTITLDLFAVLFGGAVALLPIFTSDILKTGPEGLGWLRSAPAVGSVLMAFAMAYFPAGRHAGRYLLSAVAAFGLCMIGFALSRSYVLSFSLLLFSGMFDSVSVVIRSTLLQLATPDEMRGRVAAVNSIFIGSSNELGELESGVAAKFMGTVPSVIFGGCMTLAVVIGAIFVFPRVRKLNMKALAK